MFLKTTEVGLGKYEVSFYYVCLGEDETLSYEQYDHGKEVTNLKQTEGTDRQECGRISALYIVSIYTHTHTHRRPSHSCPRWAVGGT